MTEIQVGDFVTVIPLDGLEALIEDGLNDDDAYLTERQEELFSQHGAKPLTVVQVRQVYWHTEYGCAGISINGTSLPPAVLFKPVPKTKVRRK